MNFRTSNIIGTLVLAFIASFGGFQSFPVNSETLKITGPEGETHSANRQYGPTTKSDTFWGIAQRVRPERRVSVYQVMAAIYDANPHAFTTPNYNSLEVGMILLIPPTDSMLAIPKDLAKYRAQNNDRNWQKRSVKNELVRKESKQQEQINTEIKKVEQEPNNQKKIDELLGLLELEKSQTMTLTDDLGRTQDELRTAQDDLLTLKAKLNELNDRIAALDDSLLETRQQNAALKAENKALEDAATLKQIEKPTNIWRSLLDNPLLLVSAAVLPALLLIGLIVLFIRRRQSNSQESALTTESKDTASADNDILPQDVDLEAETELEAVEDNLEELAVYLDEESENSEPVVELDDSIVEEVAEKHDSDANLDDLWSEALDEQIEGKEISSDVEELLNKLDDMGEDVEPNESQVEKELSDSENIDAMPENQDIDDVAEETEPVNDTSSTDDIDLETMLDDAESEGAAAPEKEELENLDDDELLKSFSIDTLDNDDSDVVNTDNNIDIDLNDSIDFDIEPEVDESTTEVTETEVEASLENVDNSIEFDLPVENNEEMMEEVSNAASEPVTANLNSDLLEEESSSDDLDVMLDPIEPDESKEEVEQQGQIAQAAAKELTNEFGEELDELDALMAEFGVSPEAEEQTENQTEAATVSAEKEPEIAAETISKNKVEPDIIEAEPFSSEDETSLEDNVDDLSEFESTIQDPITDDELLASFAKIDSEIEETETMLENDFSFEGDNMTVNEALAVLEDETPEKEESSSVTDSDLSQFQKENGFIDIDKLLNEATESSDEIDQYKEINVDLGVGDENENLLENASMIDVDDAENTVNAKLDLARAYIEIDDNSSAKALLGEIQIEGNERQKKEAMNLLDSIE
ncbi:hypothetical protein D5R81_09225 [Parashewanella spongiae]|uniref:Pilus assembly protein FimV n=1 Tax=Parashewanella spongiae TaxID=342950 RepID=A0A3A6TXC7_9GAMM|nr:FimV/HubP family polar landmark protein [Parashewanella spongiae]MCL1078192.1 hypothetical protein [Parashewanella spongiae]RJY16387.1 hypothetical protein D5R81_09225 [Parashewanella spongiae]